MTSPHSVPAAAPDVAANDAAAPDAAANDATPPDLSARLNRHRSQAQRLLESAQTAMRRGRWNQAEELLWGSLTAAARGLALLHRAPADTDDQLRAFLNQFGDRQRDRYIRDAYDHLAALSDIAQRVRDRALRVDHLYITTDDLAQAIERIIAAIPENHDHDHDHA